jgi:hypothetical protein
MNGVLQVDSPYQYFSVLVHSDYSLKYRPLNSANAAETFPLDICVLQNVTEIDYGFQIRTNKQNQN